MVKRANITAAEILPEFPNSFGSNFSTFLEDSDLDHIASNVTSLLEDNFPLESLNLGFSDNADAVCRRMAADRANSSKSQSNDEVRSKNF